MRLLNTATLEMEEFVWDHIPKYAILSHTWGDDEVTLAEYCSKKAGITAREGYTKIVRTCSWARGEGLTHAWVDTCCINKESSAELSEAINSMYRWYKEAAVCVVHLADLPPAEAGPSDSADAQAQAGRNLTYCRWFSRGWTLQELIAPKDVRFFDSEWVFRGTKETFMHQIYLITGIDPKVLSDSSQVVSQLVPTRMSWATSRRTTVVEDLVYCLLGIFDVNMPLLYGEGAKAFERLQHEIIKTADDLSIFCWGLSSSAFDYAGPEYELAIGSYPLFATAFDMFRVPFDIAPGTAVELSMTNLGLRINCQLALICLGRCLGRQNCGCSASSRNYFLHIGNSDRGDNWGILLENIRPDVFVRSSPFLIHLADHLLLRASMTRRRPFTSTPAGCCGEAYACSDPGLARNRPAKHLQYHQRGAAEPLARLGGRLLHQRRLRRLQMGHAQRVPHFAGPGGLRLCPGQLPLGNCPAAGHPTAPQRDRPDHAGQC